MVDKRRQSTGSSSGRTTASGRVTESAPAAPTRSHHPAVRIVAALAIVMMVATLAVGIIGYVFG